MRCVIILFIFGVITSCSENNKYTGKDEMDEEKSNLIDFKIHQEIKIPLNGEYQYNNSFLQKTESNSVIGLDVDFQTLNFYSLDSLNFIKKIEFNEEGPNATPDISSFYYHNKDSIFLFSLANQFLFLVNETYDILNRYDLRNFSLPKSMQKKDVPGEVSFFSVAKNNYFEFPFIFNPHNKNLYFQLSIHNYIPKYKRLQSIYNLPNIAELNISGDSTQIEFKKIWPESYLDDKIPNNPYNILSRNSQSQPILNFIYSSATYDFSSKDEIFMSSKDANDKITLYDLSKYETYSDEDELNGIIHDEGYFNLVYDPYNKFYYKIFKHALSRSENKVKRPHIMQSVFSIIVMNESYNYLGEITLPGSKYNFLHVIPLAKGLAISKENPFNKSNEEEFYEFDILKIFQLYK